MIHFAFCWLKPHKHPKQPAAEVTDSQQLMQRVYEHDDRWLGLLCTLHKRARILRVECDLMLGIRQQKLGAFKFSFWKAHQLGVSERKKPLFIAHEKKVKVDFDAQRRK